VRLITYAQAQGHLRLSVASTSPPSAEEVDLRLKIDQAEELVLDYVNQRRSDGDLWAATVDAWDVTSEAYPPPARVSAAVLVQLGELWRFRGDDLDSEEPTRAVGGVLHPRAAAYLYRFRDPAIA
jgi:hypothetical protein